VLSDAFDRVAAALSRFDHGRGREALSVGVVGTFALGWLLPRLASFEAAHPEIDLRLTTNNNRVDIAEEGLDFAIRFGDGAWHGTEAILLFQAPLTVLCDAATAARLNRPADLARETLLRSYRNEEWPAWFEAAGAEPPPLTGPVFDSAALMVEAALAGRGVALAPALMFEGKGARPFDVEVDLGGYWLTRLKSRRPAHAMAAFEGWIRAAAAECS
jgi:LysR family transcriptional regulator of beta-lactamase